MPARQTTTMQTTLAGHVTLEGIGAHSGQPARVTLAPADAGTGVLFVSCDARGRETAIPAHWTRVASTDLCVRIGADGASVSTVEHLMAAMRGLGVDNATVYVDGPEIPAMDGSAGAFVDAIDEAGVVALSAPRRTLVIREAVRVEQGASWAELAPAASGFHLDVEISYPGDAIGRRRSRFALTRETFRRDLARARTFGFLRDAERLWREGLALGASLENTLVLADDRVLNPEGLRFADEFVRHKTLDVIGDLALIGAPILGAFRSYRGGHRLNLALIEAVLARPRAFTLVGGAPRRHSSARPELPR
jgi:UDP-3-O-[3-hydroxymyristoyl] N-acetylglucosamine deacetylase